jgi:hypothetical protein
MHRPHDDHWFWLAMLLVFLTVTALSLLIVFN